MATEGYSIARKDKKPMLAAIVRITPLAMATEGYSIARKDKKPMLAAIVRINSRSSINNGLIMKQSLVGTDKII